MKCKAPIVLLFLFLFLGWADYASAQKKSKTQVAWERKQADAFIDLMKEIRLKLAANIDKEKPCKKNAADFIKNAKFKFDSTEIRENIADLFDHFYGQNEIMVHARSNSFPSNTDFAWSIASDISQSAGKKSFKHKVRKFIEDFTGKTWHQFSEKTNYSFESYVRKLLDYRPKHTLYLEYGGDKQCITKVSYNLYLKGFSYPNFFWKVATEYVKTCNCNENSKPTDIKYLSARHYQHLSSVFTSRGINISKQKKESMFYTLNCCGERGKEKEPKVAPDEKTEKSSYLDGNNTGSEPISTSPRTMIGGGIGLGFEGSAFDEFTFCASIEALHLLNMFNMPNGSWLYAGADATYGVTSGEFVQQNMLQVGPKVQLHKSLSRASNVQVVSGIKAQYLNRTNEVNNAKVPSNGLNVNLFTGLNFPIGERSQLGVEVPVLNVTRLTTQPITGPEYRNTDVSLLLNKENILKVFFRWGG